MRRIHRQTLSQETISALQELTDMVKSDADPKDCAKSKWSSKPVGPFKEIRAVLEAMASGRARCMYCEDSSGTDIEHFRPKAQYPDFAFVWENYLLACSHCNSNLKRNQFPLDTSHEPLLIDPTVEDPIEHLEFSPGTGLFADLTPKGTESIRVFGLNDQAHARRLPNGRRQAYAAIKALLKQYDEHLSSDPGGADVSRDAILENSFSTVLHWMVRIAASHAGVKVLGADIVALIHKHEVASWL
jgi:uncharacterized protein (TIGR02646 family)